MSPIDIFASKINVSRETLDRLRLYEAALVKWNSAINLVAPNTLRRIWDRHFLDSAQTYAVAPNECQTWSDFGSGAGFPGLVVAILAAGESRQIKMTLVESDKRKSAFLQTTALALGIDARVIAERVEKIPDLHADVISARALAPLDVLLGYSERHLSDGGVCIFLKGSNWLNEINQARKSWSFDYIGIPSKTDPDAIVLRIQGAKRV